MERGLRSELSVCDDATDMKKETIDEICNEISSNIKLYNNRIENIKQTDEAFKRITELLEKERYLEIKKVLKEDFDIDVLKEDGTHKTLYEVLEELSKVWHNLESQ